MDKIAILACTFALAVVTFIEVSEINQRLVKLEQQPKLELTCSIPDNKKRYVCRYVEIVRWVN